MTTSKRPLVPLRVYILGLPLWWVLGIDFIVPVLLAAALMYSSFEAHWRFTLSDCLLASVILALGTSAYVNGLLVGQEPLRFAAALYNLSIWVCGLILVQQVRHRIERDDAARKALLQTAFWAFGLLIAVAWGFFVLAYVTRNFNLGMTSLFGMTVGGSIPDSAALIKQSAYLTFTEADWGLPGVPMPRIVVYGPYPTATAALIAVLGTLTLLYLRARGWVWAVLPVEVLLTVTLTITLTRSILGGWLLGAIAANLIFGSPWRRIAACAAISGAILYLILGDLSGAAQYRGYSSESRFENYVYAFEQTLESNPVFGLGIKPREEARHIAVGSHSTFVSSFTKGGALGLSLALGYLVLLPAFRWFPTIVSVGQPQRTPRPEMRILFNLQVAIWAWLCFEDIDAPATAAMHIFLAFAFFECALRSTPFGSRQRPEYVSSGTPAKTLHWCPRTS
jgi:hypothetical protein